MMETCPETPAPGDYQRAMQGTALVVDDEPSNRLILRSQLKRLGYQVIEAHDGHEAVELFTKNAIDIVFMDIIMPRLNGYQATAAIKNLSRDDFVPVIFLTAITDETALAQCINAGGDDVLRRPYDHIILESKIYAMSRIRKLLNELQVLYNKKHYEEQVAKQVFNSAVVADNVALEYIATYIKPAATFNGDVLLTAYGPSRDLHILLADFTGHGLSAALGALPASQMFRDMVAHGFGSLQVLSQINQTLYSRLPPHMFMAAAYVNVSGDLSHVNVYNCGLPDIFITDGRTGKVTATIPSHHCPLGIDREIDFSGKLTRFSIRPHDRVLVCTDGVVEACNAANEEFGEQRYHHIVHHTQAEKLPVITKEIEAFCDGVVQHDDISIAEIVCRPELIPPFINIPTPPRTTDPQIDTIAGANSVEVAFRLHAEQLKISNPIPLILSYLREFCHLRFDFQILYTILAELYNNALDHGLLRLESTVKQDHTSYESYLRHRERRFQDLTSGHITICVQAVETQRGSQITITVEDTGSGFDHRRIRSSLATNDGLSGRGLPLLYELCERLEFHDPGNRVTAVYRYQE